MGFINGFPYTDAHELNLDWVLKRMKELEVDMTSFKAENSIKYAGIWDITKEYTAWSIVQSGNESYISSRPVPAGILLSNAEYWSFLGLFEVDHSLKKTSVNPIANKPVAEKFENIDAEIEDINTSGEALTARVTQAESDIDLNRTAIEAETTARIAADTVLSGRIDDIVSGASVDPDAELIDIRTGANGITYATAGGAVRNQIDWLQRSMSMYAELPFIDFTRNSYIDRTDGSFVDYNNWSRTGLIPCKPGNIYFTGIASDLTYCAFYNSSKQFVSSFGVFYQRGYFTVPNGVAYFAISAESAKMLTLKLYSQSLHDTKETADYAKDKADWLENVITTDVTAFNNTGTGASTLNTAYVWLPEDLIIPSNAHVTLTIPNTAAKALSVCLFEKNSDGTYKYLGKKNVTTASGNVDIEFDTTATTYIGFYSTDDGITYGGSGAGETLSFYKAAYADLDNSTEFSYVADMKFYFSLVYTVITDNSNIVSVRTDGKGKYNSIITAMNAEPEGTPIYVYPGVYVQDMTECLKKRVILIGTDRNQCIIRDPDGRYGHHPLYVSCGYFENLTIEAPYISGTSQEIGSDIGSYAVHIDTDDDYAIGKQIEFHHCNIISDFFPAIGAGLRKNMTLIIDDCLLVNNQNERGAYTADGTLGALYVHDSNGEQGSQFLHVKDTLMKSNYSKAMTLYQVDRDTQNNAVYCEFINNVLYSAVGGFNNTVWFRNDPLDPDTGIFEITIGFGNSNPDINS